MSSYRLAASNGSTAIVGGSKGIALVDAKTGAIIARNDSVRASDVAITAAGTPYALRIVPGNPASVVLEEYIRDLSASTIRESLNPPYGGRIATMLGELYWQAGGVVRRYAGGLPGITIDTGANAYDCAPTADGFAIVAGNTVEAWDDDGTQAWSTTLPAQGRFIVGDGNYLVAWGGAVREDGGIMLPMTVLDADDGSVVATLAYRGRNLPACAAIDGGALLVGRPDYRDGEAPRGAIDVYDIDDGDLLRTVIVSKPPLAICATDFGALYVSGSVHVVSDAELYPDDSGEDEPADEGDLLSTWHAAIDDPDPAKVALVEMVAPLLGFTSATQYATLYALLR